MSHAHQHPDGHDGREREAQPAKAATTLSCPRFSKEKFEYLALFGRVGRELWGDVGANGHKATIIVFMSVNKSAVSRDDEATLDLPRLDRRDPTLLHEQVAAQIRRAIAEGEAGPGEKIPQARDLAAELGVNTNTVLRALRVLRDEGVIEMGRGRSIRVTAQPERGVVALKLKELIDVARQHGYERGDLVAMLEELPGR
jgi:DNA-binding transcriptional regulator YhcF (GntR family)